MAIREKKPVTPDGSDAMLRRIWTANHTRS